MSITPEPSRGRTLVKRAEAQPATTEERNKAVIRQAFEDWAAGTGSLFDLFADDVTWTIVGNSPVSRTYHSRDEFFDTALGPFNARLATPVLHRVIGLYADGDTVIAYFSGSATAKDGEPYTNIYTWYLDLTDGRITSGVAFFDTIAFTDLWNRVSPE